MSEQSDLLQIFQNNQELENFQKSCQENKMLILQQQNSRNCIKKSPTLGSHELNQKVQATNYGSIDFQWPTIY